jgi:hypothetical protein
LWRQALPELLVWERALLVWVQALVPPQQALAQA